MSAKDIIMPIIISLYKLNFIDRRCAKNVSIRGKISAEKHKSPIKKKKRNTRLL